MCKRAEVNILICSKENSYVRSIKKTIFQIGVHNVFIATSDEQLNNINTSNHIDVAIIDINFNGAGGFMTGEFLTKHNPDMFVLIFSKTENIMDPIRTVFSQATDFIFSGNKRKRKEKLELWIDVARKIRDVRSFVDA
jgi:DNA-binding NtrC family response regulator